MDNVLNRRKLLKKSLLGAGIVASTSTMAGQKLLESCGITPAQTEGPFYPIADQKDKDNDLTHVIGRLLKASGKVIVIKGVVKDVNCNPIPGALVEIWQANKDGKYNHPGDPNPAPLDPNFQYWGRTVTNERGEYIFKTIKPGHYPATDTWIRPAHIHYKVHLRGYEELTTQLYFSDDRFNQGDRILQSLSPDERTRVITKLKEEIIFDGNKYPTGQFDITLNKIQ